MDETARRQERKVVREMLGDSIASARPDIVVFGKTPYAWHAADLVAQARRPVLGNRPMILRLTPTSAALLGEPAAAWHLLEKQVRTGRWTTGARADQGRLRQLAAELGVPLREEGVVQARQRRNPSPPHG